MPNERKDIRQLNLRLNSKVYNRIRDLAPISTLSVCYNGLLMMLADALEKNKEETLSRLMIYQDLTVEDLLNLAKKELLHGPRRPEGEVVEPVLGGTAGTPPTSS